MSRLTLRLLGGVSIQRGDRPLTGLPSRKAEALLIYLSCTQRPAAREVLADLLWDDRPPRQALANLRTLLTGLRRALGKALVIERDSISFNPEADYWLDVKAFEQHIADVKWQMADSRSPKADPSTSVSAISLPSAIGHLRSANDLYRGDFLAGFHLRQSRGFEEWATLERERLHRLAVLGLRRLVQHSLDRGDYAPGLDLAARLLQLDPLNEEAHRAMMLLLARSGQRTAALAQYEACRRRLAEELDVTPTDETAALYARIRSAGASGAHNLPPPATEFVGREAELGALTEELTRPACRLITLLGPGGIGKTRLGVETARQIGEQRPGMFLHGVRFIPLAGLQSAQFLAAALVEALAEPEAGDPRERLLHYLSEREMLLLLDNFEHLLGDDNAGADLLADVLAGAPMVKLLVTSRERLDLQEERLFDVGGLSVPAGDEAASEAHSAIQLFLADARRTRRDFDPPPAEMRSIIHICRILDGAPLGIELAAASTRQRSCAEIAAALERSLDSLMVTLRNVPERHRSLRAAFEHSWSLLSDEAQAHFARLSVFPDTFESESAQVAAKVGAVELSDLAEKSLLQRRSDGRYQIHPLLRQYAAEKLAAWPERQESVSQRHALHYVDFTARQGDGEAPDQRAAIRQELPNIRVAWRWVASRQDHQSLGRVANTLHNFYSIQSWLQEGIEAFQFATEQLGDPSTLSPERAPVLCDLLMRQARMQIHLGQLGAARSALEQSLIHLQQVDDAVRRSTILGYLAITHYYAGDYGQAAGLAEESLRLSERSGDQEGLAFAFNFMGSCAKAQGDYARAQDYFEQAVGVYRAMGDGIGAAMVINNLGNLAQATGDYAAAHRHYRECSDLFSAHDHDHGAATVLANAGRLALRQGEHDEARRLLTESLELKRKINDGRGMAVALVSLGDVATATGAYPVARERLSRALALAEQSGDAKLALDGLVAVAALALRQGRTETAGRLLAYALEHKATSQESRDRAQALAGELGGLPAEAAAFARRWARENTLAEVATHVLSGVV